MTVTEQALRIHRSCIVIDGHNDLPMKLRSAADSCDGVPDIAEAQPTWHTDIPRLRRGGVGAQFWAAYVPCETIRSGGATHYALEQIDLIHRMVDRNPNAFAPALSADDVVRIHGAGKIACLIGVEGGHAIENSLPVLRMFHALGVRYMTLTHADTLDWVDSATDDARHGGLTAFGVNVVREMNDLGMLVDISHVSAAAMIDVLRASRAPVVASHSAAYAVAPHPRNVPDDVLRLIRDNGGVVMVNFFSGFVDPQAARITRDWFDVWRRFQTQHPDPHALEEAMNAWEASHPFPRGTVGTVVDHIDHIVKTAGIDHVGLGSDYDGVTKLPAQLDDVSSYPNITQELVNRGYAEDEVRKILGGNLLRVLRRAKEERDENRKS